MNFKVIVSFISAFVISIFGIGSLIVSPAAANDSNKEYSHETLPLVVNDIKYVAPPIDNTSPEMKEAIDKEIEREWHLDDPESPEREVIEEYYSEACYDDSYYEDYSTGYYNDSGLTPSSGVNYYNGRTETYYSSNALYHYRTPEWTAGDDGVYRDSDGYVVVAANEADYSEGDIINTSFGPAKVYDSGCASGVTDVYVNW